MTHLFSSEQPSAIAAIDKALDAEDRAEARSRLHRLRGAAGALGACDLARSAERLEHQLDAQGAIDAALRRRFLADADAALGVLANLEAITRGNAEPAQDQPLGEADPRQHLADLERLLEDGNTRALDHLPWLVRWIEADARTAAKALPALIEAFDFPAALDCLRALERSRQSGLDRAGSSVPGSSVPS